jgi:hypothetical protein
LAHRLGDLENEIARRRANGVINYLQAFCHRQIEAVVLRDKLRVPMLALEGDRPGPLSGQGLTRLEAFLEMLRDAHLSVDQPGCAKNLVDSEGIAALLRCAGWEVAPDGRSI